MQPTVRASFVYEEEASVRGYCQQQQPQYAAGGSAAAATPAEGAAANMRAIAAQRQQWDARLASFQRGLDHVVHCVAGDACGSSLCHATRRLMRTYATHECTNPSGAVAAHCGSSSSVECKICKLWGYILTKNKPTSRISTAATRQAMPAATPSPSPMLPPLSCGLANARARIAHRSRGFGSRGGGWPSSSSSSSSSLQRRVVVTPELIKNMAKRV